MGVANTNKFVEVPAPEHLHSPTTLLPKSPAACTSQGKVHRGEGKSPETTIGRDQLDAMIGDGGIHECSHAHNCADLPEEHSLLIP